MRSEKGQTLVVFVLLLPLFFLLFGFLVDLGNMMIASKKIEDVMEDAISYVENNREKETLSTDVATLLSDNIKIPYTHALKVDQEKIELTIDLELKGNFKRLFGKKLYQKRFVKRKG